jgi:hypothetical protein
MVSLGWNDPDSCWREHHPLAAPSARPPPRADQNGLITMK